MSNKNLFLIQMIYFTLYFTIKNRKITGPPNLYKNNDFYSNLYYLLLLPIPNYNLNFLPSTVKRLNSLSETSFKKTTGNIAQLSG